MKSEWKFENLFFYTLDVSIDLNSLDKLKKVSKIFYMVIEGNRSIWFGDGLFTLTHMVSLISLKGLFICQGRYYEQLAGAAI